MRSDGAFTPRPFTGEGQGRGPMKRRRSSVSIQERAQQLRQEQTSSEALLWQQLRAYRFGGYTFRCQHPIGRFIVDFYCAERRLIIELDGPIHERQREYDRICDERLRQQGYTIFRVTNEELVTDMNGVLERLSGLLRTLPRAFAE
jgi:very-short-patch-repair endonuclease